MGNPSDYILVQLSAAEIRYLRSVMFMYHGHADKMSAGQAKLANKLTRLLEGGKK